MFSLFLEIYYRIRSLGTEDEISAPYIGLMFIPKGGDFQSDLNLSSSMKNGNSLNFVFIGGKISDAIWELNGDIGHKTFLKDPSNFTIK